MFCFFSSQYWDVKRKGKDRLVKIDGHDVLRENNYTMKVRSIKSLIYVFLLIWFGIFRKDLSFVSTAIHPKLFSIPRGELGCH